MIWPYPTMTMISGAMDRSFSTPSGRRIRSGWNTARPCRRAASLTGDIAIAPPRPFGRSGCVTTSSTECPAAIIRSRVGTANAGVPRKTVRNRLIPLAGLRQLLDLTFDQVPLQGADVRDEQNPVKVVDLMLHRTGQQIFSRPLEPVPLDILCPNL